jgi:phosphoribosyl 1,2-cyclic phosphate phosphodiesterase
VARVKLTILGCGASPGVPRIDGNWGACDPTEPRNYRTRCSALIERFDNTGQRPTRVLIDTSPDLRVQMLATKVDTIDGVVYTHMHADHVHGIDDLRAYALIARRMIDVYADDDAYAKLVTSFGYCFRAPSGSTYPPILKRTRIEAGTPFTVGGPGGPVTLLPFRQLHGDIESLGIRVGSVAYSCDVSGLPEESMAALAGLEAWVVDALRHTPHPSHFSVGEALEWIARVAPRRAYLTHLHSDLDYRATAAMLPEGVEPAYDGLSIETAE